MYMYQWYTCSMCRVFCMYLFSCSGKVTSLNGHPLEGVLVMVRAMCLYMYVTLCCADMVVEHIVYSAEAYTCIYYNAVCVCQSTLPCLLPYTFLPSDVSSFLPSSPGEGWRGLSMCRCHWWEHYQWEWPLQFQGTTGTLRSRHKYTYMYMYVHVPAEV